MFSFCSFEIIDLSDEVALCMLERKSKDVVFPETSLRQLEILVNLPYIQPCTFSC